MRIGEFCTVRVLAEGDDAGDVGGSGQDTHCFERGHGCEVGVGGGSDGQRRSECERKQEGLHTEKKSRKLAYMFLHLSERVQKEVEKKTNKRARPRELALSNLGDMNIQKAAGWQTTAGIQDLGYLYIFYWAKVYSNVYLRDIFVEKRKKKRDRPKISKKRTFYADGTLTKTRNPDLDYISSGTTYIYPGQRFWLRHGKRWKRVPSAVESTCTNTF